MPEITNDLLPAYLDHVGIMTRSRSAPKLTDKLCMPLSATKLNDNLSVRLERLILTIVLL